MTFSTIEFEVSEQTYRLNRPLSVWEQDDVAVPLLPVVFCSMDALVSVGKFYLKASKGDSLLDLLDLNLMRTFEPFAHALAGMDKDKRQEIIKKCLATVQRKSGTGWQGVLASNGMPMFEDIQLPELYHLTWKVVEHNLMPFIAARLALLKATVGSILGSNLSPPAGGTSSAP